MSTRHSTIEHLIHSTVRIECYSKDSSGTGTGFIFGFIHDSKHVPFIVTNKHVVEKCTKGRFILTLADENGNPLFGQYQVFNFDRSQWLFHPQQDVDLCVMSIAPYINQAMDKGINLFLRALDPSLIPSDADIDDLTAIEDIVMIGYPNGIWDSVHNLPIVRKGITATHPMIDHCGKAEFMIDAACFPGSSGSPVFLFNTGTYSTRGGDIHLGGFRVKLLGILYAGPQHFVPGEIKVTNTLRAQKPISISGIPNNLGFVIKSKKILDFEDLLK